MSAAMRSIVATMSISADCRGRSRRGLCLAHAIAVSVSLGIGPRALCRPWIQVFSPPVCGGRSSGQRVAVQ
ncbi:hypothetical protein OG369_39190 [Streptomyces sp. NBC_01221]|uniref:hypothetical protein n=1 Tax=Streptomyces sp. NBC_01221 TaxID=2903782 RepID=UPI00224DC6C6|nr:hypothetical protein [Streptomyces sp. NBC_01221]MCX4791885.1 hypothetical protein [Streptomyces sp. NBC_01221]